MPRWEPGTLRCPPGAFTMSWVSEGSMGPVRVTCQVLKNKQKNFKNKIINK